MQYSKTMGISEIKTELRALIDSDDEKLLRMFYALAREYKSHSPLPYPSLSEDDLTQELKEAEQEIKRGEYDDIEDFEKRADKWE